MGRIPPAGVERAEWLASLPVEHDHVNPDDIDGYWDQLARQARAKREAA